MLHLTTPGSHLWLWGLKTRTGSPGCTAGRGLDVLSYCNCCFSSLAWSLELVSPSADKERLEKIGGERKENEIVKRKWEENGSWNQFKGQDCFLSDRSL